MSAMASTAPTSWKCTSSGSVAWMRASASASRRKASCARAAAVAGSAAASMSARTSPQVRWTCSCGATTSTRAPEMPWRSARVTRRSRPSIAQAAEALAHGPLVGARVQQRGEQHVAGDARDAVDVEDHDAPPAARAMRAAIVPAPKPSSMLTTASPAAHELSIASSAETPPKAEP